MLSAGNSFPNFALPNQDGRVLKLSDYAGQWLVVYFYPKDDTPGCTIQGQSFTATKEDFDTAGVGGNESRKHADGGGLACAVGPEESEEGAARDLERDAIDGGFGAVGFAKVANDDGWGHWY